MSAGKKFVVSEKVSSSQLGYTTVLLDMTSESYLGLDETGSRIWASIVEHGDPEPAVRQLLDEFNVEESQLRTDVDNFLIDLQSRGLLGIVCDP